MVTCNPNVRARIEALLAVLFWGGSFTAIKVAVSQISPTTLLWLRFGIGTFVLGGILYIKKSFIHLPTRQLVELCGLGFLGVFLHSYIQSAGLRTAAAGISGLIIAGTPILIALLGSFFLKERITKRQSYGIILAAFGVMVILSKGNIHFFTKANYNFGELLVVCSAFTWALFSVLSRKTVQTLPPALSMFFVIASGWIFCSIPLFVHGLHDISYLDVAGWGSVAFLGVLCSAVAYVFWYDALKALPASEVGVFLYLNPIVAVSVAWLFLGEPLLFSSLLGGLLVLVGVGIVNYHKKN